MKMSFQELAQGFRDFFTKKQVRWALIVLCVLFLVLEIVGSLIAVKAETRAKAVQEKPAKKGSGSSRAENAALRARLQGLMPQGRYIIVDTGANQLYLNEGRKNVLTATVSCGSGSILTEPSGKRTWIFETPRGEFRVQSKKENPTWVKPDWAFVEEGEDIPKNISERFEEGVLGAYALGIGNGYFIHGTLYKRMLGRNVTHGCIRVGDDDLKEVYEYVSLGTRVIIF